jgi:hypothetical protein
MGQCTKRFMTILREQFDDNDTSLNDGIFAITMRQTFF